MASTFFFQALCLGIGATLVMDAWVWLLKRAFGIQPLDYAMVGRWIGHLPRGRMFHDDIKRAAPIPGESALGWTAHYVIGVVFAMGLLAIVGVSWLRQPSLLPALAFGIASVAAPFFLLQPALGAGIAASKTPRPGIARLRSLMTHAMFGIGLYLTASAAQPWFSP